MCKFCENLERREYIVSPRTCSSDDNKCEIGSPMFYDDILLGCDCSDCDGCATKNSRFGLITWDNSIQLSYVKRIKRLIIEPYSEVVKINFCPWCGKPLTDTPVDFDKCCCGMKLDLIEG